MICSRCSKRNSEGVLLTFCKQTYYCETVKERFQDVSNKLNRMKKHDQKNCNLDNTLRLISLHGVKGPLFWDPKPLRKDDFPICRACGLLCSNTALQLPVSSSGTAVRCHTGAESTWERCHSHPCCTLSQYMEKNTVTGSYVASHVCIVYL